MVVIGPALAVYSVLAVAQLRSIPADSQGGAKTNQGSQTAAQPSAIDSVKLSVEEKAQIIAELEKRIAGRENDPADSVFKNIQVLKGLPAIRVLRIMTFGFSPALGVDCLHCHVLRDWEKDDKEAKMVARKMWTMTIGLNKEVQAIREKAVVNCYTCHRGAVKPAINPPATK